MTRLITLLFGLLLTPLLCLGDSTWNHAHEFLRARALLIAGDLTEAEEIFDTLCAVKALQPWCSYYSAEAAAIKGRNDRAKELLSEINQGKLSSLAARISLAQLTVLRGKPLTVQTLNELKIETDVARFEEISAQQLLLEGIRLLSEGDLLSGSKILLELNQTYPRTVARKKSFLFRSKWLKNKSSLAPEIRLINSRLLGSEKEYDQALEWLSGVRESFEQSAKVSEAEATLSWELDLLVAANRNADATKLLSDLSSDNSSYKEFALSEIARRSWQKNEYDTAKEALGRLPQSLAFRSYLLGRIAEEQSDFDLSISHYRAALAKGEFTDKFHAAFRMALLLYARGSFGEAASSFAMAKEALGETDSADFQAAYFWEQRSLKQSKAALEPKPSPYDIRSVYFWLERGATYDSPAAATKLEILNQAVLSKECSLALTSHPADMERLDWGALSRIGLSNYLGAEIRLAHPGNDLLTRFKRIALYDYYGAHAEKFREFWERKTFAQAFDLCPKETLHSLYPHPYFEIFQSLSTSLSLEPELVISFSRTESAFNPLAVSRSGAMGLMQLMPMTAAELGFVAAKGEHAPPLSAFYPPTNIRMGATYIRQMLDHYSGRWFQAVAAYNAGPVAVDRWVARYPRLPAEVWAELIPYKETRDYVKRVLSAYWIYSHLGDKRLK